MKNIIIFLLFNLSCFILNAQINNDSKTIFVGLYENKPKAFINEKDEILGFFPELIQYFADKENWLVHYIFGSWTECLQRLKDNEIDIMIDVAYSEERAGLYDFNEESVFNNWGIIYRRADSDISSITNLENKRIAVMKNSIHYSGNNGIKKGMRIS
jgi:ABC-type amino acid transport substrate-binding protein